MRDYISSSLKVRRQRTATSILSSKQQKKPKMICPRCVLPLLALFWFMEVISAATLMTRNTRELNWTCLEPMQNQATHLDAEGDAAELGQDSDSRPTQIESPYVPTQRTSTQHQSQFQYISKKNNKRRKVVPIDSIGRFKM